MINQTNNDILFQSEKYKLQLINDELFFFENDKKYHIISQPYEPCLYINDEDKMIKIIHNSFTTSEIIDVAQRDYKIDAISGTKYDINKICDLLAYAIEIDIFETDIGYLENQMLQNKILDATDDFDFKKYKEFMGCVLDYCILKYDLDYRGEESHKEAVILAMKKWQEDLKNNYDIDIKYNTNKMKAKRIEVEEFFAKIPENDEKYKGSYLYLFLNPPHGCSCTIDDFNFLNSSLFPNGFESLEIFDWSTDWSNYFDDGLEWWGARCVSIFDKSLNRFVVIGASATD